MITNILLNSIFRNTLQTVFSSIVSLQILAHLPLANIQIPANAQQSFDIMIDVVSFDLFQLTDYVDFGFTETEPWSSKFEELGYETVNFMEGMGSIILFLWIGLIYLTIVAIVALVRRKTACKFKPSWFRTMRAVDRTLGFLQGTFFETMVCTSVSMRSFEYFQYLNAADKFSIANHIGFLLV